jgi:hypothetical protein
MSANFATSKAFENQWRVNPSMAKTLLDSLAQLYPTNKPLAVHWSHHENDRAGVDAFIEFSGCLIQKVDFKFRSHNSAVDWVTVETIDNIEKNQIGWAGKPTQANDFVFVRALPNGLITEVVRIDAIALRELVCTRLDDLRAVGTVKRASSFGKFGKWNGEFIAISPDSLAALLPNKVKAVKLVGGAQ